MTRVSYVLGCMLLTTALGCGDSVALEKTVVRKVSGDGQQVLLGQPAPAPLVVLVTSSDGVPLAGVQVNWAVISGGGTLSSSSSTTDQSGNATVMWTLGPSGDQSVKAWTNGAGETNVIFSAVPITQLLTVVSGNAQKGPFGVALPSPLVVSVTTANGTPVPNVKVNWGVYGGGGSVSSSSSTTDQNGKASVTWTLGPSPWVNQTLKAWTDTPGTQSVLLSATGEATLVLHYDGTTWSRSLLTEQYGIEVNTGWAASPSIAFAAGTHCQNPFVLTFSNGFWSGADSCTGTSLTITSMSGTAANDVWAVGTGHEGSLLQGANYAWVFHYDGSGWTTSFKDGDATHPPQLVAVTPRTNDDVIVVGTHGRIIRHAGQQWNEQTSGTTNDLLAVWSDPNSAGVFAVGDAGTVLYNNGTTTWQPQTSGTTAKLRGVWGTSSTDIFAVGANGTILHYNGSSWTPQTSGTTQELLSVWGVSPTSVYAVGGSAILHYDGSAWTPVSTNFPMDYRSVWGTSASSVFVGGTIVAP